MRSKLSCQKTICGAKNFFTTPIYL